MGGIDDLVALLGYFVIAVAVYSFPRLLRKMNTNDKNMNVYEYFLFTLVILIGACIGMWLFSAIYMYVVSGTMEGLFYVLKKLGWYVCLIPIAVLAIAGIVGKYQRSKVNRLG